MSIISQAAADGYACLSSWADLLDRINVFPVPDSDTGTNLRISLAPLQQPDLTQTDLPGLLARSATGNSGNIAAAFLQEFLQAKNSRRLTATAISGRDKAQQAVLDPKRGTMLDVFDTLAGTLTDQPLPNATGFLPLCEQLQNAVLATSELLPELKSAGVVDSGALGMFIFLEGFFQTVTAFPDTIPSVSRRFKDKLTIAQTWSAPPCTSHCIDALLDTAGDLSAGTTRQLAALGDSIVVSNDSSKLKIHLHTSNPSQARDYLTSMGELIHWDDEDMAGQMLQPIPVDNRPVHIMTDAAGSLDRETAKRQNITLLDSYIIADDQSCPESHCPQQQIYERMSRGERVSTAQASTFERHQHYGTAIQQFNRVLYLCVGSVYTGNYAIARAWKNNHDHRDQFHILDSGAASGRLALITLLTARFADKSDNTDEVISYAQQRCQDCREYVFIDELKYLAAGGRVSRTKGFFGDLLHMKPVISPMEDGVKKVGMTRSRSDQLEFALNRLQAEASPCPLVLLQYSDNRQWLQEKAYDAIRRLLPKAEIIVTPLSLTSGVHMGPGTWAIAFKGL